mmetsp:Transcript_35896/g.112287  ORF Transcript_35896/g.112287 Transcript_35896/m.112287 type:complete len:239 (+) Transcript_35896:986-1702(+)
MNIVDRGGRHVEVDDSLHLRDVQPSSSDISTDESLKLPINKHLHLQVSLLLRDVSMDGSVGNSFLLQLLVDERASCPSVAEDEDAGRVSALLLDFGQAVANLVQEHVSLFRRLHFNEVLDDPGGDVMQLICLDYLQMWNLLGNNLLRIKPDRRSAEKELEGAVVPHGEGSTPLQHLSFLLRGKPDLHNLAVNFCSFTTGASSGSNNLIKLVLEPLREHRIGLVDCNESNVSEVECTKF